MLKTVRFLGLLFCTFFISPSFADTHLKLTAFKSSGLALITVPILAEAYERVGQSFEIINTYGERALALADQGYNDGVVTRTSAIEKHVNNLIRVPTPVFSSRGVAFLKRRDIPKTDTIQGFAQYRIAVPMGYKNTIRKTQGMNRVLVPEFHHALRMVDQGLVDVALMTLFDGLHAIKKVGFKEIYVNPAVFEARPLYHYLHRRHKALIGPLDKALSQMKSEGRFDIYEQQAREKLLVTPPPERLLKSTQ